jgi:prefoldin subunit 5
MDKLQELKAQAYDLLANIEWLQGKLREVNMAIAEETKKQQDSGNANSGNSNN